VPDPSRWVFAGRRVGQQDIVVLSDGGDKPDGRQPELRTNRPYGRGLATGQPAAQTGGAFNSHFDFKQESSQAPKKSRKLRKASEADGKSRKISSFFAQK
jgi:hypothetical protein